MSVGPTVHAPGWNPGPDGAPRPATAPAWPRNGTATAALTLGILCMLVNTLLLVSIPAFVLSVAGLSKASRLDALGFGPVGRTKAVWGLVLSVLGTLATVFVKVLVF